MRKTLLIAALLLLGCRDRELVAPLEHPKPAPRARRDIAPTASVDFFVHAAPQSWQLFMGNVAVASLQSGRKVVFIHASAGDNGKSAPYWRAREAAALASVDAALSNTLTWTCAASPVNGHPIHRCVKSNIVVYFMRMPDGNPVDGQGFGFGSMSRLRDLATPTSAIDGSTRYVSWADFIATVRALVLAEAPSPGTPIEVHAPDYDRTRNPADHPDNYATADAVRTAIQGTEWTLAWYLGFTTINLPVNLTAAERALKQLVWNAYDSAMVAAGFPSASADAHIRGWLDRTYFRVVESAPDAPSNLQARATASSRVALSWADNSGAETGFQIERAPDDDGAAGAFIQVAVIGANATAYDDHGANPGTTYWYRVRAFNDGGPSAYTHVASATTPASNTLPYNAQAWITAHADDWQLFAGDRAVSGIQSSATMLFVYTTAGDGGMPSPLYWQTRELGALASIDVLIGPGEWNCTARTIGAHAIRRCAKGSAIVYFMRLPDGDLTGLGFGRGSIEQLRDKGVPTSALDGSATYATWGDFTTTIASIVDLELDGQDAPYVQVHTQENMTALDPKDHPDHNATGDAVTAASRNHAWSMYYYVGYDLKNRPINLTSAQHAQSSLCSPPTTPRWYPRASSRWRLISIIRHGCRAPTRDSRCPSRSTSPHRSTFESPPRRRPRST